MIQRYNAPDPDDKYYIHTSGGGYNKCIRITGYSVLANCVGYAYGRFMQCGGVTTCTLSTGDAENWWDYPDGYARGQTPRPGAVMCWRKGAAHYGEDGRGHVEVVEQVNPDGSVITTGSDFGGTRWYRHTRTKPYAINGQSFQGFIYNPYIAETKIPVGASDQTINGHKYSLYRQSENEAPAVLSAGLNKLDRIQDLNADVWVMAKVTGANFFNNEPKTEDAKNPDPFGTTYGDISAPLNDVWRQLPNQNTTLYFDYETGAFGDCTGIKIDPAHNVASPSVVYPKTGNYQYARMIERNGDKGSGYLNTRSRFSFAIRTTDGRYIAGIALEDRTPKEIAEDFRTLPELESIQFFDGGDSAQFGRVNNAGTFEYVRTTPRKVPSAFAIISKKPYKPESEPTEPETEKDEEQTMPETKPQETPENVTIIEPEQGWTDPEPKTSIISERIAALLSVKSILTLVLTGVLAYLVVNQYEIPEFFQEIFKIVILFFFGYQTGKAQNGGGK